MVGITRSKVIFIFHDTFHKFPHHPWIIHAKIHWESPLEASRREVHPLGCHHTWVPWVPYGSLGGAPSGPRKGLMDVYSTSKYGIMMYGMRVNPKSIG